jgi:hypothetical protein
MEFYVLEFGVSIKTHLGRESKLYRIENSEINDLCSQQHVFVVPAVSVGSNSKNVSREADQRDVERRQTDKKASTANIVPLIESLVVTECSKQVDIEEHQNKENENPAARMKELVNCDGYIVPLRSEERKVANLDGKREVPDCVCSTVLRDQANSFKGTSFSQQIRIRMGTKTFSNVHKEDVSSYQKPYATASIIMSDTYKQSSLQDAYVLSKCNFCSLSS